MCWWWLYSAWRSCQPQIWLLVIRGLTRAGSGAILGKRHWPLTLLTECDKSGAICRYRGQKAIAMQGHLPSNSASCQITNWFFSIIFPNVRSCRVLEGQWFQTELCTCACPAPTRHPLWSHYWFSFDYRSMDCIQWPQGGRFLWESGPLTPVMLANVVSIWSWLIVCIAPGGCWTSNTSKVKIALVPAILKFTPWHSDPCNVRMITPWSPAFYCERKGQKCEYIQYFLAGGSHFSSCLYGLKSPCWG